MTYLPAPYEAAHSDDLPAALAAGLAGTVALITAWVTGSWVYPVAVSVVDALSGNLTGVQERLLEDELRYVGIPAAGWTLGVVFMVFGALLLCFRRGRGALVLGALLSLLTTVYAQFALGYGTERGVDQWPVYWGGAVVLVLALLPAMSRWVRRGPRTPAVIGPTLPAGRGSATTPTLWSGI